MLSDSGSAVDLDLNTDRPAEAPGGGASHPCTYCDPVTVANLAESLLRAVAQAAVLETHAKPFASPSDACPALFAELRSRLLDGPELDSPTLPGLQAVLGAWVESKRSWLTRAPLASEQALAAKAESLRDALLADASQGAAWVNEAEALAPRVLARWDGRAVAHCRARLGSAEGLAAHKGACDFRPTPCPNDGCFEVLSAAALPAHDAQCAHKPVPCAQACPLQLRRRDMAAHCAQACANRAVACPFALLGCREALTAGSREAHVAAAAPPHLSLLLQTVLRLSREAEAGAAAVAELRGAAGAAAAAGASAAAAAEARVKAAEAEAAAAKREAAAARKEAAAAGGEAKRARDEAKRARDEAGAIAATLKTLSRTVEALSAAEKK